MYILFKARFQPFNTLYSISCTRPIATSMHTGFLFFNTSLSDSSHRRKISVCVRIFAGIVVLTLFATIWLSNFSLCPMGRTFPHFCKLHTGVFVLSTINSTPLLMQLLIQQLLQSKFPQVDTLRKQAKLSVTGAGWSQEWFSLVEKFKRGFVKAGAISTAVRLRECPLSNNTNLLVSKPSSISMVIRQSAVV